MKSKILIILIFILEFSCTTRTGENSEAEKTATKVSQLIEAEANKLSGLWLSDDFLNKAEKYKSIYADPNYNTKVFGLVLNKKNLLTDSAFLNGFTTHEGGYDCPLVFDNSTNSYINNLDNQPKYSSFTEPFELKINKNDNLIIKYLNDEREDTYRRIIDIQTELRKILLKGEYSSDSSSNNIQFDEYGNVSGFNNLNHFDVIYDFGEGINYDAIVMFSDSTKTNWSEGKIYKYEFKSDTLNLYPVETNWEEMNHKVTFTPLRLIKK